jgi:16S rRNA (cytidine1402-2'-O)-methyltransferase
LVASPARGRLLVVGTPIGNLGDLAPRAAEALRSANLIAAEDTRVTTRLLAHLGFRRPIESFNEHNAVSRLPGLLARLAAGETVALTTDAGMPGVSDPGASLVSAAREAGCVVEVIPGPAAVTAAVAVAGFEASGFVFGGFLPSRPASARRAELGRLLGAAQVTSLPLVLYEAPHRMANLLDLLAEGLPEGRLAVCRELTKRHEEVVVGTPREVADQLGTPRGEFTVVIGAGGIVSRDASTRAELNAVALARAASASGIGERTIVELLRAAGVPRRQAYAIARGASREPELISRA